MTKQSILAGELLALKVNIGMSADSMTNPNFGNLVYDNPEKADSFVTRRLIIQGKTLSQVSAYVDTMLTYYKRYYAGTTPSEEYNKLASALTEINAAFRSPFDTVSWNPFVLKDSIRLDQVDFLRRGTGKEETEAQISFQQTEPEQLFLLQNYPNPFNPLTVIRYSLIVNSNVTLKVYNLLGQGVATLLNHEETDEGEHEIMFDASSLSSGMYFYRLTVERNGTSLFSETKKLILLK